MVSPELILCPKCETETSADAEYCPGCGYEKPGVKPADLSRYSGRELAMESVKETSRLMKGPFSFAFPAVENAYKGPERITTSASAIILMLAIGLPAGLAAGAVLYVIHWLGGLLFAGAAARSAIMGLMALIAAPVLLVLTAVGAGAVITGFVHRGARAGNCTSRRAMKAAALAAALASAAAYFAVQWAWHGRGEMLDTVIDYLRIPAIILSIAIAAVALAGRMTADVPFCPDCRRYMKKALLGPGPYKGWPVGYEKRVMGLLAARQFGQLKTLGQKWVPQNFTAVTIWYCDRCRAQGIANASTTQTRSIPDGKGGIQSRQETRLVFSSRLSAAEIEAFLASESPTGAA
jgi:hypothetical protein